MADQTNAQFDFEDWAGLYLEDPQEFEARRSAALMIELTRGSAQQCANGRIMLAAFEKRVVGQSSQQRFQVAASMLAESAMQLRTELMVLREALKELEQPTQAEAQLPAPMAE